MQECNSYIDFFVDREVLKKLVKDRALVAHVMWK